MDTTSQTGWRRSTSFTRKIGSMICLLRWRKRMTLKKDRREGQVCFCSKGGRRKVSPMCEFALSLPKCLIKWFISQPPSGGKKKHHLLCQTKQTCPKRTNSSPALSTSCPPPPYGVSPPE